MLYISKLPAHK